MKSFTAAAVLCSRLLLLPLLVAAATDAAAASDGGGGEAPVCRIGTGGGGGGSYGDPGCQCSLYVAPSDDGMRLFSGANVRLGVPVLMDSASAPDLLLPIRSANKNEYSPWHNFVWTESILLKNAKANKTDDADFSSAIDYFCPGIGSMASCAGTEGGSELPNILFDGSIFRAAVDLQAGEELVMDCSEDAAVQYGSSASIVSMEFLQQSGICLETLEAGLSTVHGRGAFAKRSFPKDSVVAISPVIQLDRSQTDIVQQQVRAVHRIPVARDHGIEYNASQVLGQQLLLNYAYGSPDANILLLPAAPVVNLINHGTKPNVMVRWSSKMGNFDALLYSVHFMELLEGEGTDLVVEYVALREIAPGDELLLDYGPEWRVAFAAAETDPDSFRHWIGVPAGMFPPNWNKVDPNPYGDFIPSPLPPAQMAPIRWAQTAEVVTPWAFRLGLQPKLRHVLLEYCHKMGITEILRHVTVEGNGLQPGTDVHMNLEGDDWYLQRPAPEWRSNLHWFSPGAGPAHEHYLQALSVAGFDEMLEGIGQYLGMDGLVAFHVTFIGVSFSNKGYLHHDVVKTGAKVYNVIVPLILANDTGPELDLQSWHPELSEDEQEYKIGRYRYEYDVASMMGDNAYHATSAVDYRVNKEMRMAATIYIADVNDVNAENIMGHYTQAYPPPDINLLKSWEGRHWKRSDPSRRLPVPPAGHILLRAEDA
jgi:SET domain